MSLFAFVAVSHATLLRLPYYWDEGGYYIPAALDFYHRYTLIPTFTNAHPPLPNIVLGTLWHMVGYHIPATRLLVCAFAAAGLLAVFRIAQQLLNPAAAIATTLLTALYPIWFAQSTLAHADIFAAAFTLWALMYYFAAVQAEADEASHAFTLSHRSHGIIAALFSLAALSKETAIVQPAALAAVHLVMLVLRRTDQQQRKLHLRWLVALVAPVVPLAAWFAYHRARMGFTFGNPEFLRYNATANFTAGHIASALRYRAIHLFWQRDIWVPLLLVAACVLFLKPKPDRKYPLSPTVLQIIALLVGADWIAFSILGGALLTRYLLPVYPLLLLLCVAVWRWRTNHWPVLAAVSAAAFLPVLWWNPPVAFAPEDNLTYRDMIVVHQEAITYIDQHFPDARVLTAWPAAAELFRPELGYTDRPIRVTPLENFSAAEIGKAAQEPGDFDTALVFSKNFFPPLLRNYLNAHQDSARGHDFAEHRDLLPGEIARELGGTIVFHDERNGEWAAVLRFPRRYEAALEHSNGLQ